MGIPPSPHDRRRVRVRTPRPRTPTGGGFVRGYTQHTALFIRFRRSRSPPPIPAAAYDSPSEPPSLPPASRPVPRRRRMPNARRRHYRPHPARFRAAAQWVIPIAIASYSSSILFTEVSSVTKCGTIRITWFLSALPFPVTALFT